MNENKRLFDTNARETKALIDEIVHGIHVKEGMMVAFPTCFPGVTVPIPADESHITALDAASDGMIYGGTTGRKTHLFVGMFHGVTGAVFDMGVVEGADHCAAMCCGQRKFAACVNGPEGGRIVVRELEELPYQLIQEWKFKRTPFEDLGQIRKGERIVHAVTDLSKRYVVGTTVRHLFFVDLASMETSVVSAVRGTGRVAVGSHGNIFGLDDENTLWRYFPETGELMRNAVKLPEGAWDHARLRWARNPRDGTLYTADKEGRIFAFCEAEGFGECLGQTMVAPVGPMAVTLDGRLFGSCGEGIARLFCHHPTGSVVADLGVAVSVIERRRYGYVFGDAVVGRDGEIVFGEDDDLGHLWLYFPKIEPH